MQLINAMVRIVLVLSLGDGALPMVRGAAADSSPAIPPVIQAGFTASGRGRFDLALDVWQKGGLMEGTSKVAAQFNYFKRMDRTVGNYKTYEVVEAKKIGQASQIVYLAINFERAAVYARFVLYRPDKNWVVQNMDFSTKPEAIMPWLAFEEGTYTE
jgi:hypothetical protein